MNYKENVNVSGYGNHGRRGGLKPIPNVYQETTVLCFLTRQVPGYRTSHSAPVMVPPAKTPLGRTVISRSQSILI